MNPRRSRVLKLSDCKALRFYDLTLRVLPDFFPKANLTFIHESLPARRSLPAVLHKKTGELVFCLSGAFTVVLNRRRHALRTGHLVWIPPGTWHTFETGSSTAQALSVFHPALRMTGSPDVVVKHR